MDMSWADKLRALADATARTFGQEIFDLETRTSGKRWWVRVTLDRLDGPVTLADCEGFSRQLSAQLDVEDIIPHAYELEVSSPGVERPLRSLKDFERFKGQPAKIVLGGQGPDAGQALEGDLEGADETNVMIRVDDEVRRLPMDRIRRAHLVLKFP